MADRQVGRGSDEPRKYCAKCAVLMVIERIMPRFGPLPEIRLYRCLRCGGMLEETIDR